MTTPSHSSPSTSSMSDELFLHTLFHMIGRKHGIKDTEINNELPNHTLRHILFLSGTATRLYTMLMAERNSSTEEERKLLAEVARLFILKPLREFRKSAKGTDCWSTWSAEHGFDVQACYILLLLVRVGVEIDSDNPKGSYSRGWNSLSALPRKKSYQRSSFDNVQDRALVESLPQSVMSQNFWKKLYYEFDLANKEEKRLGISATDTCSVDLRFPPSFVALTRYIENGSDANLPLSIFDEATYVVTTGFVVYDPPTYQEEEDMMEIGCSEPFTAFASWVSSRL